MEAGYTYEDERCDGCLALLPRGTTIYRYHHGIIRCEACAEREAMKYAIYDRKAKQYLADTSAHRGSQAGYCRIWGGISDALAWDSREEAERIMSAEFGPHPFGYEPTIVALAPTT